jgi:hypothetical protein
MQLTNSVVLINELDVVQDFVLDMQCIFCRVQSHTLEVQSSVSCTVYLSRDSWFFLTGLVFLRDETAKWAYSDMQIA